MPDFPHILLHSLEHSLQDTLYLIPVLFITYVIMEWIEHKAGKRTQDAVRDAGIAGPFIGALLGAVPQCGFSAMAATLYAGRVITLGTLFAVFLSTSDEMLPIFIAENAPASMIISILGIKVAIGMVFGFLVDAVLRITRRNEDKLKIHELCANADCGCSKDCATCQNDPESVYEHVDDCSKGCDHKSHVHDHAHDHGWSAILKSALKHTVQVMVFILVITFALDCILELVGEDVLSGFLRDNAILSIFASGLVGLIPNCAASVVIADLYIEGILGAGAMLSGLLVAAGVGLLVLFQANRHLRQNLLIVSVLYAIGVACGLAVYGLGIVF